MNRNFLQFLFFALLAGSLSLFTACPVEPEDSVERVVAAVPDEGTVQESESGVRTLSFTLPGDGAIWYFSLSTGEWMKEANDPYTPDWDLAFQDSRIILTNSGDTEKRLSSGGLGGVWFTNQTDFDAVTSPLAGTLIGAPEDPNPDFNYLTYHRDYKRYIRIMGVLHERWLNVMTYAGYRYEDTPYASADPDYPSGIYDGSSEKLALSGHAYLVNFEYNKKAYYVNPPLENGGLRMPPDFEATGQVYIVRHGNGVEYSKFQVTEFYRDLASSPNTDAYTIKWQTWPEGTEAPED